MATLTNGDVNGHSPSPEPYLGPIRFSNIPKAIDIPVSAGEVDEAVEVPLEDLPDDTVELCTLLDNENVAKTIWTTVALAYAKQDKIDAAIEVVNSALGALSRGNPHEKLSLHNLLAWLYLVKCRGAPRVKLDSAAATDVKLKEHWLAAATATINDASRINPSYPPLFLARGVQSLLRAGLQQDSMAKGDTLRQAARSFEDAARASKSKNTLAYLGRGKALFSLGKYSEALQAYQHVLEYAPDFSDPDPRIGIGCCFWALGYKDDAQGAWSRALEINPDSKIANILLGLYYLNTASHVPTTDPNFAPTYKKAIVQYTQKAFKLDSELPLACTTFGGHFLVRKSFPQVETLAKKAIELTDVSAIASDGWYLLARKEHFNGDALQATDYYSKADQARGGDERGYLPAKLGTVQLQVSKGDYDSAKFRLEKIIQQSRNVEAMSLLGALFCEDVFSNSPTLTPEEQASAARKAIALLEGVRTAWKDPKRNITPDSAILLNLARLYEVDNPEKSLQCLEQVEQMELDELADEDHPDDIEDPEALRAAMRENLKPQLLNNLACFHYQASRLSQARDLFQTALNACVKHSEPDSGAPTDTDALVTTISFNLARTYEAENMLDEARNVYEGLLTRHPDYIDALTRLTYIALRQSPQDEGPKSMSKLFESDSTNMEVRSLFGWYMRRAKRKTNNIAEDQEQRHHKHTLQGHDKHDRYALTAMGSLYLQMAREMRRDTDQDREKRTKQYTRAVEFFDKALQLDPRNAYAAMGIGIAVAEDKKDYASALQIFSKVRETVKDAAVFTNLGHVNAELKHYSRAIENYEQALAKDRAHDPQILACLGRAWLLKGKQEKSVTAMHHALDYSQRALAVAQDQIHFRFNVAFVQIQIAQLLYSLPDAQRSLVDVAAAAEGLDAAIEEFSAIAKSPNPPFPRQDIEQRANMGRNTMKRQLERAVQSQREYEDKNAERLRIAREQREAEMEQKREAERQAEEQRQEEAKRIAREREKMQERDRELAQTRAEQDRVEAERRKDDFETDEETGEKTQVKKKRSSRKRKKKDEFVASDDEVLDEVDGRETSGSPREDGEGSDGETVKEKPRKKKRRLERRSKGGNSSKYKSAEVVVDSDEEMEEQQPQTQDDSDKDTSPVPDGEVNGGLEDDEDGEDATAPVARKSIRTVLTDDEDE